MENEIKKYKYCQSCGMPLQKKQFGDMKGTEKDKTPSNKYCKLCYENGKFTKPDATLDSMYSESVTEIKNNPNMSKFKKRILLWFYTKRYLSKLERWNSN